MAQYRAILMHGKRGGEGQYDFEADAGLIKKSAMATFRALMDHLQTLPGMGDMEWHVVSVHRSSDKDEVAGIGNFEFEDGTEQPFACFISEL